MWTDIVIVGTRLLCAYGFAPDEALTLELYTPDGKIAATYILPAIDNTDALEGREIAVNIPYSLPYGSWTAVVRDRSLTARDSFTHPDREVTNIDLTHLLGAEVLHPSDPRWRMDYKQGDLAAITGVGFQANSTITVVVARSSDVYAEDKGYRVYPLIGWNVQVDARGDFYIQFSLDRSFTDGDYLVLANPKSGRSLENESWLFDIEWYKVFSPWRACRLGPLSGLHKGGTARLNVGPPNNLRDEPRVSGRKIGQIQELQSVTILDGPMCSDGMTWWFVEVIEYGAENYGLKGWTAEGDASAYWLVPGW